MAKGVFADNMRIAYEAAHQLMSMGHWPFVPHLFWHLELWFPRRVEAWLDLDKAWLERCDAILRLPGESVGADLEMGWAKDHGLLVFDSIEHVAHATEREPFPAYRPLGGA
jgi:hypothetical protein